MYKDFSVRCRDSTTDVRVVLFVVGHRTRSIDFGIVVYIEPVKCNKIVGSLLKGYKTKRPWSGFNVVLIVTLHRRYVSIGSKRSRMAGVKWIKAMIVSIQT